MLDFFRRYQRYFFVVITIFTIVSFSFFGTYSTLGSNVWREQLAFKAVDGQEITRSDVDDMANFIATDNEDKLLYGGIWGPNFLNDGVIRKDFLETGLAQELASAYQADLQDDLQKRLEKEKKYPLYVHPQARFLSTQNTWGYFMPEMNTHLYALRAAQKATDPIALDARIKLFLTEKKFPAPTLKQVLRYQEKQYSWLTPDKRLEQEDLSLFGYHTVEDWFGPQFTRLISQFIINAAILAEQQGYSVSKAEALADLIRQTDLSYQQNKNKPTIGVASPEEYFAEQLRRLNMDQARAIKIWRQVLLFRRYFQDSGRASLVDTLAYQKFNDFSQESLALALYRLPEELRFGNYATLQNFETYLQAVTKPVKDDVLAIPTHFLSKEEVAKGYPELVQKRYTLEIAQVNKKALQSRIGLKETWNWEVDDKNWTTLKQQFPDLGIKKGETREERFAALDSLDAITRAKVDAFARSAIVDAHPQWLTDALEKAQPEEMVIGLRPQGGKALFAGLDQLSKRQELIRLLDLAPLKEKPQPASKLYDFTADQQAYYRITVLERAAEPEVLTFAEANADGTLDQIRERLLENYYVAIREQNRSAYQKEDQTWKEFSSVRDLIADQYFDKTLKALQQVQKAIVAKNQDKPSFSKDQAASLRFYPYLKQIKTALEQDPLQSDRWVRTDSQSNKEKGVLADQWRLEKTSYQLNRGNQQEIVNAAEAFALPLQAWSAIRTPANGDLVFFQVQEKGANPSKEVAVANQVKQAYDLLSNEAQRLLMKQVLAEISTKNAISLAYLKLSSEEVHSFNEEVNEFIP